jgi:hypothetical protein
MSTPLTLFSDRKTLKDPITCMCTGVYFYNFDTLCSGNEPLASLAGLASLASLARLAILTSLASLSKFSKFSKFASLQV